MPQWYMYVVHRTHSKIHASLWKVMNIMLNCKQKYYYVLSDGY